MSFTNIPQLIFGLYKMITGVQVAVVFQSQSSTACLRENANRSGNADPIGQGGVKMLDINLANVGFHPFIKYGDEELPIRPCFHRPFGDLAAFNRVERPVSAGAFAPSFVGNRQHGRANALDDRNELDKLRSQFITEETVDLQRVLLIRGVYGAEDIEVNLVLL